MADLAPAPLRLVRAAPAVPGLELVPALEVGAGGEARVYALPGDAFRVAKVYREPTEERARKLARMVAEPPALPAGVSIAWPQEVLADRQGRFAGFVMPRAEGPRVFEFYNPVTRRQQAPLFHYGLLHRAGRNLAAAFEALHAHGYVVGDVNESNILVEPDGDVTLVDADSFQVPDPAGGVHRSHVGKAEFTPPELQGVRFAEVDRAPEHDRFGLGVLLFLLLMEGTHPFAVRLAGGAEAPPLEERIRRGLFPHARRAAVRGDGDASADRALHRRTGPRRPGEIVVYPPRLAPLFETLDPALRALFLRCFVDGHADAAARPAAGEWREALALAEDALLPCARNPQHRLGAHLRFCPWCERTRLLRGRDPFPATAAAARAKAPPRPAPAAAPAAPKPAGGGLQILPPGRLVSSGAVTWLASHGALEPVAWILPAFTLMTAAGAPELRVAGALAATVAVWRSLQPGGVRRGAAAFAWSILLSFLVGLLLDMSPVQVAGGSGEYGAVEAPAPFHDPTDPALPLLAPDVPAVEAAPGADFTPPVLRSEADLRRLTAEHYPPHLRERGIAGSADLRFQVLEDGTVNPRTIRVESSTRPGFELPARELAPALRFHPATQRGRPMAATLVMTIDFRLDP